MMRPVFRLSLLFSAVLFVTIAVWFISEHEKPEDEFFQSAESVELQRAFNEQLSEDVVLTVEMFMEQAVHDIETLQEDFRKDEAEAGLAGNSINIDEHPHIDGVRVLNEKTGKTVFNEGYLADHAAEFISSDRLKAEEWKYSEPYDEHGEKKIALGRKAGGNFYLAQIDLSFIEHFVKDMVVTAGDTGNFIMGNSDTHLALSELEADAGRALSTRRIPELDWDLQVVSENGSSDREEYKKGEVIVQLEEQTDPEKWAAEHNVILLDNTGNTLVVRDLTRDAYEMLASWEDDPDVVYMEPNFTFEKQALGGSEETGGDFLPNDEFYGHYQWNLQQMNLEEVWQHTRGGEEVATAVLDSGVAGDHPDLSDRIVKGYNAFDDDGAYQDYNGHGTHVAGTIGAVTNNDHGIAGVTWGNPLFAVKVLDDEAVGNAYTIAKGIRWATDEGAKVINLSLGDDHHSEIMHDAVKYAYENDAVLVAATGNDGTGIPMYPAAYDEVLAVGSVNSRNELSFFSNYGNHVDVTAPGEHIPSTYAGNEFVMMSGTSMAAPHVSGIAALLRSAEPQLANAEIYQRICETAVDLGPEGFDPYYGYGMINPEDAMKK